MNTSGLYQQRLWTILQVVLVVPPVGVNAATLTRADLESIVAEPVANGVLQAVSLGAIQPTGSISAHAGALAPEIAAAPDDRTIYEIGSITKVFTSLLLAEAVVRGEVTLDWPIARLLPADTKLPHDASERITLRMLATHTSGLPRIPAEIPPDQPHDPYADYSEADLWKTLRDVTLEFEPGTQAGYSNLAAGLLGTLLARHAGISYPDLLAARITGPLGMTDTVVALREGQHPRRAPPFRSTGEPCAPWEFQALAGAGGIRSTMADMMRFAGAVLHPENTPLREAFALAWEAQELKATLTSGGQTLGWMLAGDRRTHWHNGMTGGFHAALFINRKAGVAAILLANRSTPVGTELAEALFRRAAGMPDRPSPYRARPEVSLTEEQLDRCTGTFRLSPEFALVVERQFGTLFVTPTGQATDRLHAASADTYFSRRVAAEVIFEFPPDGGPATALTLRRGGQEMRAQRN